MQGTSWTFRLSNQQSLAYFLPLKIHDVNPWPRVITGDFLSQAFKFIASVLIKNSKL